MNKRFSTLLAIALMVGGLSASAQFTPGNEVATKLAPADKYYHIKAGAGSYLSVIKTKAGDKDSLVTKSVTKGDFSEVPALDSVMWKLNLTVQPTSGDSIYTFENKVTGTVLSVENNKEVVGIVKDGNKDWSWKACTAGATSTITYKVGSDVFSLDTVVDGTVKVQKNAAAAVAWNAVEVADMPLSAEQLNEANGTYFKLAFNNDVADNVFTKYQIKAIAVNASQVNTSDKLKADVTGFTPGDSVMLRVIGAPGLKSKWNDKVMNDSLFIIADTVRHNVASASWNEGAGFKFGLDTLTNVTNQDPAYGGVSDTVAAKGRNISTYLFKFMINKGRIAGDSLIVSTATSKVDVAANTTAEKGITPSYVSWAYIANGSKVLSTAAVDAANIDLPGIEFMVGTKFTGLDAAKKYYIKVTTGDNKDKYVVINYPSTAKAFGAASPYVASTQWAVEKLANGNYNIFNRELKDEKFANGMAIYEDGANGYKMVNGAYSFIFEEAPATDEFVGYKHFTAAELKNLSVALQFNSSLGTDAMVYVKDSILHAAADADATTFKLKVANAGTVKFGDNLTREAYILTEFLGDKVLGYDRTNEVFKLTKRADGKRDTVAVVFRATPVKDQYQLITLMGSDVYDANNMKTFDNTVLFNVDTLQATFSGTEAKMVAAKVNSQVLGTFTVTTPDLPEWVNVSNSTPAHMTINSAANSSLAITMAADGSGVLKGESDLKAGYAADDFKLYVDTACMENVAEPKFYFTTTRNVDAEKIEEGIANYMIVNKDNKVVFVEAKQYGIGKDTLIVGKDSTMAPKAQFMFANTKTAGEYKVYNVGSASYLRQVNGALVLDVAANALPVTVTTVDTPTGNESTEANTISVVAGEGNVTVYGAAGKAVTVSNVLGQKTTIVATSDSEVIAAPQGVVIVAVEGEAAVKAVVK
ncbi:DUF6383 domain-containing protein [Parabacteroides chinchillae]|uniref:DUF6383 domain-containing protein n=1 Tax=Parabacteroides chinchillae TaxID=871327 RepID=A0A8G2BUW7_9BACT|nr:DUF6383 domain-containing protein [Parabacteroides chinchillae]SEF62217.1 hypothetical protein SAMN05444001_103173 [Parabacteroides chinchillae]